MAVARRALSEVRRKTQGTGRMGLAGPESADPSVVTCNASTDRAGFSINEVAQMLGCGEQTISDAVNCGELPAWRFGRRVIIPKSALEFGPRVDLHVDIDLLADQLRLSSLLVQQETVELEISRVKNRLQARGIQAW